MVHHLASLNWLSVLLGSLTYFALGAIWYSPLLFVKQWIKLAGINVDDPSAKKGMVQTMLLSFVMMFLTCVGIGMLRLLHPPATLPESIHYGLMSGFFFAFTSMSIGYLYTKKPLGLYLVDGGYHIVGMTLASLVMHYVG